MWQPFTLVASLPHGRNRGHLPCLNRFSVTVHVSIYLDYIFFRFIMRHDIFFFVVIFLLFLLFQTYVILFCCEIFFWFDMYWKKCVYGSLSPYCYLIYKWTFSSIKSRKKSWAIWLTVELFLPTKRTESTLCLSIATSVFEKKSVKVKTDINSYKRVAWK